MRPWWFRLSAEDRARSPEWRWRIGWRRWLRWALTGQVRLDPGTYTWVPLSKRIILTAKGNVFRARGNVIGAGTFTTGAATTVTTSGGTVQFHPRR